MNKSEYLDLLKSALNDDDTVVTMILDEDNVTLIGNMPMETFEDVVLQIAEAIADKILSSETIH